MITIARVKQATSEFIKVLRFGKGDVQTSTQIAPYGIDSKPVKEMLSAHTTTSVAGDTLILGYVYKSDITKEGEIRIFSEGTYLHFKTDGTAEFNGDSDNFIRYTALETAQTKLATDINAELTKIATATGGAYVPTPILIDISASKIEEIKTKK